MQTVTMIGLEAVGGLHPIMAGAGAVGLLLD
jgi:hypothetical protein